MRLYRLPPKKPHTGASAAYTKMMVVSSEPRLREVSRWGLETEGHGADADARTVE